MCIQKLVVKYKKNEWYGENKSMPKPEVMKKKSNDHRKSFKSNANVLEPV